MEDISEDTDGDTQQKKILVIRFSSIGDVVLTTPIVRCIKKKYPKGKVHFLTKQQNACIFENNPYVEKTLLLDSKKNMVKLIKQLRQEDYDFVVDLQKNLRSHRILWALRKPYGSFDKLNIKKWLLVRFKKNLLPKVHIVDRYFHAVKRLGVVNDGLGLDYFLQEEDYIPPDALPIAFQNGYTAMAVGAKHTTKQIPTDILIAICQKIEGDIILLGDLNDKIKANKVENAIGSRVFNGCGSFSLNQTASLIATSKGIITADTGLMHIAAALKKNIISLWGNTVPEFGMTPYLPLQCQAKSHIFEVKGLKCRPCSKLGYKKCPRKHFRCMKMQDTEAIAKVANTWSKDKNT